MHDIIERLLATPPDQDKKSAGLSVGDLREFAAEIKRLWQNEDERAKRMGKYVEQTCEMVAEIERLKSLNCVAKPLAKAISVAAPKKGKRK